MCTSDFICVNNNVPLELQYREGEKSMEDLAKSDTWRVFRIMAELEEGI
jgi:hypothetical protein